MFVAGRWTAGSEMMEVRSPYDGHIVGEVPRAGEKDVETALAAAGEGATVMAAVPSHARAAMLARAAEILHRRAADLAEGITLEEGKTLQEARAEVARAVETLRLSAEESKRLFGETLPMDSDPAGVGKLGFTLRVPVGVVVAITPFNFPLNLVCHKVGPALGAGNAVIVKPAERFAVPHRERNRNGTIHVPGTR